MWGEARHCGPQVQTSSCPGRARGWAGAYVEEESRDWCEALDVNQAQTVREVSFPGSNVKKPEKIIRKLKQTVSQGVCCCFPTKAALIILLLYCKC